MKVDVNGLSTDHLYVSARNRFSACVAHSRTIIRAAKVVTGESDFWPVSLGSSAHYLMWKSGSTTGRSTTILEDQPKVCLTMTPISAHRDSSLSIQIWSANSRRQISCRLLFRTWDRLGGNLTIEIYSLTHGPPFGVLDETTDGSEVGCEALRSRLAHLQPRLHLFGHIHEAHGVEVGEWSKSPSTADDDSKAVKQTVFVNGANWPAGHRATAMYYRGTPIPFAGPGFQPVVVDLLEV